MVGIRKAATLEIWRERMGRVLLAVLVGVMQPLVLAVGAREPPEVMVEGAVLHHQHDEGVDGDVAGAREAVLGLNLRRLGDEGLGREHRRQSGEPRQAGGAREELATPYTAVVFHLLGGAGRLAWLAIAQFFPFVPRTVSQS